MLEAQTLIDVAFVQQSSLNQFPVLQSADGPVNEPEKIPMQLKFSGSVCVPRVWSLHA